MKNLWKNNFKPLTTDTPKDIVQYQCASLGELTKGEIVAGISEYSELFPSNNLYPSNELYHSATHSPKLGDMSDDQTVDLQNKLGENAGNGFTFEFYITSIATPNYKYRVMFLQYGVSLYPLTIIMDEAIANELGLEQFTICSNQEDFEATLAKIINSDKVGKVISVLLGNIAKKA